MPLLDLIQSRHPWFRDGAEGVEAVSLKVLKITS